MFFHLSPPLELHLISLLASSIILLIQHFFFGFISEPLFLFTIVLCLMLLNFIIYGFLWAWEELNFAVVFEDDGN